MRSTLPRWSDSPERATLLALYAEADGLVDGWACACTTGSEAERRAPRCCHFAVTGREPYPTAVELEEVRHAMRVAGIRPQAASLAPHPRRLRVIGAQGETPGHASTRPCPLLSTEGRCRIYASRPLGCRTFFCHEADGPSGSRARPPREAANAIGRRMADLSARFSPLDPHPRPLVRALLPR